LRALLPLLLLLPPPPLLLLLLLLLCGCLQGAQAPCG
jgi:hypothetical protein